MLPKWLCCTIAQSGILPLHMHHKVPPTTLTELAYFFFLCTSFNIPPPNGFGYLSFLNQKADFAVFSCFALEQRSITYLTIKFFLISGRKEMLIYLPVL